MALAWHPVNENLLSFGTNEGRVGVFNIGKIGCPPDLIKNFNAKDLYSMCYSVDADSNKCILYVPNGKNLMMFDENSYKNDEHKAIEFKETISSVSVNANYVAVGFSEGTLKILLNNQDKTVNTILLLRFWPFVNVLISVM